jgi:hypothetical protein
LNSNSNLIFFYFQTKSNGACMETTNFTIQPYQYINSHSGRSRQIIILGKLSDFSK